MMYYSIFIAGSVSGLINACFSCPLELIKIRLQNQDTAEHKIYKGPIDCLRKTVIQEGYRGLFKGFRTTLIRETPSYGGTDF